MVVFSASSIASSALLVFTSFCLEIALLTFSFCLLGVCFAGGGRALEGDAAPSISSSSSSPSSEDDDDGLSNAHRYSAKANLIHSICSSSCSKSTSDSSSLRFRRRFPCSCCKTRAQTLGLSRRLANSNISKFSAMSFSNALLLSRSL